MASLTCGTGDFGTSPDCWGEAWIRTGASVNAYKGGPAFYGATDHFTHTKWDNPIMVGYNWGYVRENTYHFAAAAVRGKIQLYLTFPRFHNAQVQQYFYSFNMLGDPELSIRTKNPEILSVNHAQTLELGINYIDLVVTSATEVPIEGAYVTVLKKVGDVEEFWNVGQTDANGFVSLSFDPLTTGTMYLTVSGRDLFPYQGSIEIVEGDVAVGYSGSTIDDDNGGYSSGNGDGIANPDEVLELSIDLENFGVSQSANGVVATLESLSDEIVTVLDGVKGYGDIAAGATATNALPFVVKISQHAIDNDVARVKITSTANGSDSWDSIIEIPISGPRFNVTNVTFDDVNGRLDPGETVDMILTVNNYGSTDASSVNGYITTFDDYTTIIATTGSFGDIAAGASGNNTGTPMIISSDIETFEGRNVNMLLHLTTNSGVEHQIPFNFEIGTVTTNVPFGPDNYGYFMYDDTDTEYDHAPTYSWFNITSLGSRLNFGGYDDASVIVDLPFDFTYYGDTYTSIIVCINGFFAVDTVAYDMAGTLWYNFYNWPLPDPGNARGQISVFWDDLKYSGSVDGVYTYYDSDANRFIIQWQHMDHANNSTYQTFQAIIYDPVFYPTMTGDAEIVFNYSAIQNTDSGENYCSVGLENWDENDGLEYTHDNFYPQSGAMLSNSRAIKITTNTGRGGVSGTVDLNSGGQNQGAMVSTSSGQHRITPQSGQYWIKDVPPGQHDVDVTIDGYFPATATEIAVLADRTTRNIDFSMTQCPIPGGLSASDGLGDRIEITWDAVSHADLEGYDLFRAEWENGEYAKVNMDPIVGTSFSDFEISSGRYYWYYVVAVYAGSYGEAESFASNKDYGHMGTVGTDDENPSIPSTFYISQNYPNPFNPSTTISYGLPSDSNVKIKIYNLLGQSVRLLVDEHQTAGYKAVVWDGHDHSGSKVSSGVYFYTIDAGNYHDSKKMLMIK
jgi:hypothetical protein